MWVCAVTTLPSSVQKPDRNSCTIAYGLTIKLQNIIFVGCIPSLYRSSVWKQIFPCFSEQFPHFKWITCCNEQWAADPVSYNTILKWELQSAAPLCLLVNRVLANCISHESTASLISLGGPRGSGGCCETLAPDRIAHHNPPTDAQLCPSWGGGKDITFIFFPNRIR